MCKWFHFLCLIIFILCVLCTALGGQALAVLFLKIGTLYWHRKKKKTNKVSYCLWFHHQCHSMFCTVECPFSSLSLISFFGCLFSCSEKIKTKKVSLCNRYPHPLGRRQPKFKLMRMSALGSCYVWMAHKQPMKSECLSRDAVINVGCAFFSPLSHLLI